MTVRPTAQERAFQIARSGECATLEAIEARLEQEHFGGAAGHISSRAIRKQLTQICKETYRGDRAVGEA